ncbi:MAG: glutathione S-transferase N-terminal domain-containing protein [Polyangiaceae bacterium]
MLLYFSPTSPFVRKVLVLADEVGLRDAITLRPVTVAPTSGDSTFAARNPLGKIPALELDDGTVLYDSRVICEYLDTLHTGRRMVPASGPERWTTLRTQALADGATDAAVLVRYETHLRPEDRRWSDWTEGQCQKIIHALGALDAAAASFGDQVDLGQIAAACAVGYLLFRDQLAGCPSGPRTVESIAPRLMAFFRRFSERPSMLATMPSAPQ